MHHFCYKLVVCESFTIFLSLFLLLFTDFDEIPYNLFDLKFIVNLQLEFILYLQFFIIFCCFIDYPKNLISFCRALNERNLYLPK